MQHLDPYYLDIDGEHLATLLANDWLIYTRCHTASKIVSAATGNR